MRVVVGSDMRTYLAECIVRKLGRRGYQLKLLGAFIRDDVCLHSVVDEVVNAIVYEGYVEGILICWDDVEATILLNKTQRVKAVAYTVADIGEVKRWEKANVLVLSPKLVSEAEVESILESWFSIDMCKPITPIIVSELSKLQGESVMHPIKMDNALDPLASKAIRKYIY
jgi:ribose 5-phosphate isomerase RpiB